MILVTGATGTVGGEVVDALVEQKEPVRALARTPQSSGLPDGVEVVEGDLDRPETLAAALHGARGVFLLAGFSDMAGVLDQIATAGVGRVVLLVVRCRGRRRGEQRGHPLQHGVGGRRPRVRRASAPSPPPH